MLTDASGNSASTYNYSAFGQTRTSSGSIANEVRFSGERTDTESGLEFLRARTYDPNTGTFLQRDSWGITPTDGQSINSYAYTQNSPVNLTDPSGHCSRMIAGDCVSGEGSGSSGPGNETSGPQTTKSASASGGVSPVSSQGSGTPVTKPISISSHQMVGGTTQSCTGLDIGCYANTGWQHTGGALVNSSADGLAWAAAHPGETVFLVTAVGFVALTCYATCTAILTAATISAGGDLALACAAGCSAAAAMALPSANLAASAWNWSNADDKSKQIDTAAWVGMPESTSWLVPEPPSPYMGGFGNSVYLADPPSSSYTGGFGNNIYNIPDR